MHDKHEDYVRKNVHHIQDKKGMCWAHNPTQCHTA